MRIAYLDCFAGIAGDMFLGALIDAGVPEAVLHAATSAMQLGAHLRIETVDRSGISSTKVHVMEGTRLAEQQHVHSHHEPDAYSGTHSHHPKTQLLHKGGHHQEPDLLDNHKHGQEHGRSLTQIRALIDEAPLQEPVKALAMRAFELLGRSEAKIHNVPVDEIHFHEVGAVDAIVDIVAASAGIHHLQIGAWHASAVNVGGGMVKCAHGIFPVPAPATADLLRDAPTYSAHVQKELVTPTGAALLRALAPTFGAQPPMRVARIGYGAGTRNPKDFPNVLRLSIGEDDATATPTTQPSDNATTVRVLEVALDDMSPQLLAYVAETVLAAGALDVMMTPVTMKKGRLGTLLTVLARPEQSATFEEILLTETSTLGLRLRTEERRCLDRHHVFVSTRFGDIRIKVGIEKGTERNAAPEYEDCRAAAAQHGAPLKQVHQAAMAAYLARGR